MVCSVRAGGQHQESTSVRAEKSQKQRDEQQQEDQKPCVPVCAARHVTGVCRVQTVCAGVCRTSRDRCVSRGNRVCRCVPHVTSPVCVACK